MLGLTIYMQSTDLRERESYYSLAVILLYIITECFQFLRALQPMVICNGILGSPLWTLDHTEHGDIEKELCKLVYRHQIWHKFMLGYCDHISLGPKVSDDCLL